jgi:hypothetical protein
MTYTIKIKDDSSQAQSLLRFLKSLSKDYPFIQITEENEPELNDEIVAELDSRYEHFIKHSHEYKNWEEVKQKYSKK